MGDRYAHLRLTEAERILAARIEDLARVSDERGIVRFSSFLDCRQQEIARCAAAAWPCEVCLFGGHAQAERAIVGLAANMAPTDEEFPIAAVTLRYRAGVEISHRDILGALMALRIKRETVGDILVGDNLAVVFVLESLILPILQELEKVGSAGVRCEAGLPDVLPEAHRAQAKDGVVSSLRLDCVVALATGLSREQSQRLVRAGLVQVNARVLEQSARELGEGDLLSIRGHGRFRLSKVGSRTKKDRLHITIENYI